MRCAGVIYPTMAKALIVTLEEAKGRVVASAT